jgi:hypothetical protein
VFIAQHQRLGRARLLHLGCAGQRAEARGQRGIHVFPQREDALLRIVVAELVDGDVELDVGALVDARRVGIESTGARQAELLAAEELPQTTRRQALAAVIDAGVEVRRARLGLAAVGDELGTGHDIAAG